MVTYITKHGDVLDWICWKHYGTVDVLEQLLKVNGESTEVGYSYPAGTIISLPVIEGIEQNKREIKLWD